MVKRITCLILCIIVLSISLAVPAFAVDPSPSPTPEIDEGLTAIDEKLMSYYVWLCMRAWGIDISYKESVEFNDHIESQIYDWVTEYLGSLPSAYTINQWIAPWQSSFDYWGNYRFNDSALEDIQDFVDWLIDLLNLNDNSEILISDAPGDVNGYTVYMSNTTYVGWDNINGADYGSRNSINVPSSTAKYLNLENNGNPVYWLYWYDSTLGNNDLIRFVTFSRNNSVAGTYLIDWEYADHSWGGTFTLNLGDTQIADTTTHYAYIANSFLAMYRPVGVVPFIGNEYELKQLISRGDLQFPGVSIDVGLINLPDEDANYTPGDSITIIDDKPEYSIIEWNGEVTVSNLPAIVSTGSITNPGIVELFRPFSAIAQSFAPAISTVTGIMYNLDENIVSYALAIIGIVMLLGFIKIMRS